MITVFTPSFADEADTNAQNLTVKEVAARLSPEKFRLVMLCENSQDPRIANRPYTRLLRWRRRGKPERRRLLEAALTHLRRAGARLDSESYVSVRLREIGLDLTRAAAVENAAAIS
jgi:hypothetical protein